MITQNRKYISLLLIALVPLALIFRQSFPERLQPRKHDKEQKPLNHQSNASSFEHPGVLDDTLEGAPKMSQVSMQYGGQFDITYERALRTHVRYGEKVGYPTHYLRQDLVGHGDAGEGMFNKLLYLLTIMVNEHTKPYGKRSEWIA